MKIPKVNQNPLIEEGQTTQRQAKRTKGQTMIYKTLHRKLKIEQHKPTKTGGFLRCPLFVRESSPCSTSDTRRVTLVTNPVISHGQGKDREVLTTTGTYTWSHISNR